MNYLLPLQRIDFSGLSDKVFVTGSRIEGFGNVTSDLDYFVFTETLKKSGDIFYDPDLKIWIDVSYFTIERLHKSIGEIRDKEYVKSCPIGSFQSLDMRVADFLHRMQVGQWLSHAKVDFSIDRESLNFHLAKSFLEPARARLIDCIGEHLNGCNDSARHMARIAMELVLEANLALLGQTNPNSKWLYKKLNAVRDMPRPIQCGWDSLNELYDNDSNGILVSQMIATISGLIFTCGYYILQEKWVSVNTAVVGEQRFDVDGTTIVVLTLEGNIVDRINSLAELKTGSVTVY